MEEIKGLDVVALTENIPKHDLRRGDVGTVVERWKDGAYEVEFSDHTGEAYAFVALRANQLMKLHFSKDEDAPVMHLNPSLPYKIKDGREKTSIILDSLVWAILAMIVSSLGSLVTIGLREPQFFSLPLMGIVLGFVSILIVFTLLLKRMKKGKLKTAVIKEIIQSSFISALDNSLLNPANKKRDYHG